jgi:hypothetical protein
LETCLEAGNALAAYPMVEVTGSSPVLPTIYAAASQEAAFLICIQVTRFLEVPPAMRGINGPLFAARFRFTLLVLLLAA